MPDVEIMLDVDKGMQYILEPKDYMFMPFLNYTDPIDSRCQLALLGYDEGSEVRMIVLG